MKSAITPDYFFKMPSLREANIEADKKGATDEEIALFNLSETKGWKILEQYITNLNIELNEVNRTAIQNGASLEEIGRNTVVISMTQEIISKILNKVSDSIEACNKDEQ